jgi:hypothetical protein
LTVSDSHIQETAGKAVTYFAEQQNAADSSFKNLSAHLLVFIGTSILLLLDKKPTAIVSRCSVLLLVRLN